MSDHRTVLLYVPAKLPDDLLHEFVITHMHGDSGQDAWQHLITLAAIRENPLSALIHRLWIEAGGDTSRKVGEVTEGELMNLIDLHKRVADSATTKAEEERILQVKDHNGEPQLVFHDATGESVTVLLSEVANNCTTYMPFAARVMRTAVEKWRKLKIGGQTP